MEIKDLNYPQFKSLLNESKRNSDPIFCKFILRPLSFPIGWIFYKIGMKANTVSIVSILLTLISCNLILFGNDSKLIMASLIMILVALTDCIDGNIARARKETGPLGEWMDALSGYTVYALLPLSLGIYLSLNSNFEVMASIWVIIGAATSIANLYQRLIYQKFINSLIKHPIINELKKTKSALSKLSGETGLVGWMMPLLFLATLANMLEIYLAAYCFFYIFSAMLITIMFIRRASHS